MAPTFVKGDRKHFLTIHANHQNLLRLIHIRAALNISSHSANPKFCATSEKLNTYINDTRALRNRETDAG
jgi:hypothetical protein